MNEKALELLLQRRSVAVAKLGEPGPDDAQIDVMLRAASRVPDHRKLTPWRFIIFKGEARAAFGSVLADACAAEDHTPPSEARLKIETERFLRAPVVVAAISSIKTDQKATPEWEQVLSAGAACQNLVLAANALGFATNWITEWYAYSPRIAKALRLGPAERVAGFIYIGTAPEAPEERERPVLAHIVSHWRA